MEADEISVSTDDKTEDFCDNPTRDSLTEGLMNLLKPTVDSLQNSIRNTKYAFEKAIT
jgi:SNARE-associated protein Snapin